MMAMSGQTVWEAIARNFAAPVQYDGLYQRFRFGTGVCRNRIVGWPPLPFFGDYMCNTAAAGEDTAIWSWSLGDHHAGTWSLSYNYRDVEADALLGVLGGDPCRRWYHIRGHKSPLSSSGQKYTICVSYMPKWIPQCQRL